MRFSIVIPVYNVEKYIEECIESILNQTYQAFEIILVDDGSTDRSGEICDRYVEKYCDKIKVIHNKNQGQLKTRSCGIKNATGDVLLIVDSDDCIRENSLEILADIFENTNCDMVLFNAQKYESQNELIADFDFIDGQQFSYDSKRMLYELLITTSKLNPLWLKAVKKNVANAVPAEYEEFGLRNAGDFLYSIPMLSAANSIIYADQNLYYYRTRNGSIVNSYNPERHRSIKKVHMELEKYIDEWGMAELHGKHYAREVRGWIDCLKLLLLNERQHMDSLLKELAEDGYFRNAYEKMDNTALSGKYRVLSKWLYGQKYARIRLSGVILRAARAIKRRIKG